MENYVTEREIIDSLQRLDNDVDKAIVYLTYKGTTGTFDLNQLIELKVENFDLKNKKIVTKDGEVEMDHLMFNLVRRTINEEVYFLNGKSGGRDSIRFNMDNPYFLKSKPSVYSRDGMNPLKITGLRARFEKIRKDCGLTQQKNIQTSGIVNMLIELGYDMTAADVAFELKKRNIKANAFRIYKLVKEVMQKGLYEK